MADMLEYREIQPGRNPDKAIAGCLDVNKIVHTAF